MKRRIVQVLDHASARDVLSWLPWSSTLSIVALDDRGELWVFGLGHINDKEPRWTRLWLSALPETPDA